MTTEELLRRQDQFRGFICKRYPHVSKQTREDAASWALIKWLEGVGLKQDFKWLFIDYMRTGLETGLSRGDSKTFKIIHPKTSIFEKLHGKEQDYDEVIYEERIKDLLYDLAYLSLDGKEIYRTSVCMYYFEDCGLREIAEKFNLSESRISQILNNARKIMGEYARRYKRFAPLLEEGRI